MMGEPAYTLIVHSTDPTRGRGDNYDVEVYVSGAGDVELAKIYISIPAYIPETFERSQDGMTRFSVKTRYLASKSSDLKKASVITEKYPNVFDLTVPHYFFTRKFFNADPNDLGVEGERIKWDSRYWMNIHYAPFSFNFKVARNAPSGDHNIYLHLVYKDCLRWYSNSAILKIHIKQWYEEDYIRILVMLAAIASIISGSYALHSLLSTP
jgi:hypothetical protein